MHVTSGRVTTTAADMNLFIECFQKLLSLLRSTSGTDDTREAENTIALLSRDVYDYFRAKNKR
jgi:hypothetical protein